ncbi:MAG: hypothetical protein ACXABY_29995 [Candidatus Thorarchaeota archaeon]|jgi:hypothetical protein
MAGDIKWEAPTVALTSYLTTTLNAMANDVIDIGAAINNETNLCTFMDLEVTLASLDLSAQSNPSITIYMFESVDGGTDFDTNQDGVSAATDIPTADKIIAIMGLRVDTAAEAKTAVKSMIPIPPGRFKLGLRNTTGQTLGATGNILAYRTYNIYYS